MAKFEQSVSDIGKERADKLKGLLKGKFEGAKKFFSEKKEKASEKIASFEKNVGDKLNGAKDKTIKAGKFLGKFGIEVGASLLAPDEIAKRGGIMIAEKSSQAAAKGKEVAKAAVASGIAKYEYVSDKTKSAAEATGKAIDTALEKAVMGFINGLEKGVDKIANTMEKTTNTIKAESQKVYNKGVSRFLVGLISGREQISKTLAEAKKSVAEKKSSLFSSIISKLQEQMPKIQNFSAAQEKNIADAEIQLKLLKDEQKRRGGAI